MRAILVVFLAVIPTTAQHSAGCRDANSPCVNAPIVVPTKNLLHDERGAEIGGSKSAVLFDIDADGAPDRITWPRKGTQLLVADLNGNGVVDDGSELFGRPAGSRHQNGFEKLRAYYRSFKPPIPDKAFIELGDPMWDNLLLWDDANENAKTEPGELRKLENYIRRLGLGWILSEEVDEHGNAFRWKGWAEFNIGKPSKNEVGGVNRDAMFPIYDVRLVTLP
jgi:hypothetical protein